MHKPSQYIQDAMDFLNCNENKLAEKFNVSLAEINS